MSQAIAKQASETSGYPVSYMVAWLVNNARPLGITLRLVMSAFVMAASKNVTPYSSTPSLVTVRDPSKGAPHLLTVKA
jgi:hypothetical protein